MHAVEAQPVEARPRARRAAPPTSGIEGARRPAKSSPRSRRRDRARPRKTRGPDVGRVHCCPGESRAHRLACSPCASDARRAVHLDAGRELGAEQLEGREQLEGHAAIWPPRPPRMRVRPKHGYPSCHPHPSADAFDHA